jgi:hypothetical protein
VIKEMTKAELILKTVMYQSDSPHGFIDNYLRLWPVGDIDTFRSIIEMKGYKRSDVSTYVDLLRMKIASNNKAAAAAAASAAASNKS